MIFIASLAINSIMAQEKLVPPNSEIQEPRLKEFLVNLEDAVYQKEKDFILNNLSPHVTNSFGGDGGIEEFKQYWNWEEDPSAFWKLATKLFELGGGGYQGGDSYRIPYVSSDWPGHEKYNVFDHMAITGSHVNVRERPDRESKVMGQLTYDIVKVDYEKSFPAFTGQRIEGVSYVGQKEWYHIESLDGEIRGFVYWDYIWSPIGYRLGLKLVDGEWEITFLVAGD